MKLSIIGTGYVGLVTGTCFAEAGNTVTCVDVDEQKVASLQKGIMTIYEPGLEQLFNRNTAQKRLRFTTDQKEGVRGADIVFLALPTPQGEDGSADLQYVLNEADVLGDLIERYTIIVDKSTVPVGTSELVRAKIAARTTQEFDVVSNPEFLREGRAVQDFMRPDRVVIGTSSPRARKIMETLYAPFVRQGNPLIFMDERSAELTKYAANAFLATKISFMNEIANICERFECNVDLVRKGIGTDSRIGKQFLFPGLGYGGSCFPKDLKALTKCADDCSYDFKILNAVMSVNDLQRVRLVDRIKDHFGEDLKGKHIAIWGLAFKPHTDDVREASSIYNIRMLLEEGATVSVYDPEAMEKVKGILGEEVRYHENAYDAAEGADALLVVTEWPAFRTPDFNLLAASLKNKVIFDGRNLYDLQVMQELGFTYYSIGRTPVNEATTATRVLVNG